MGSSTEYSVPAAHLKNMKANHDASNWLKCAGIIHSPSRWAGLNMTPSQQLADDRDANGSDTNVFASDREITVTYADADLL
ncbi:MAG: hypothetical protein EZS28_045159, partial [Streblomastix strix]